MISQVGLENMTLTGHIRRKIDRVNSEYPPLRACVNGLQNRKWCAGRKKNIAKNYIGWEAVERHDRRYREVERRVIQLEAGFSKHRYYTSRNLRKFIWSRIFHIIFLFCFLGVFFCKKKRIVDGLGFHNNGVYTGYNQIRSQRRYDWWISMAKFGLHGRRHIGFQCRVANQLFVWKRIKSVCA